MRKRRWFSALIFVIPAVLAVATLAVANDGGRQQFRFDNLSGYQEPPAISTTGNGTFEAWLDGEVIRYTLTYGNLEGGAVLQAHIHFGQRATNGGIIAFLCGTAANPGPAGTPACPQPSGSVSGEIEPADIIGPMGTNPVGGQGIEPGAFDEAVKALRAGVVYANVHTTRWPGGEIRGQVIDRGRQGDNDDDDED